MRMGSMTCNLLGTAPLRGPPRSCEADRFAASGYSTRAASSLCMIRCVAAAGVYSYYYSNTRGPNASQADGATNHHHQQSIIIFVPFHLCCPAVSLMVFVNPVLRLLTLPRDDHALVLGKCIDFSSPKPCHPHLLFPPLWIVCLQPAIPQYR